MMVMRFPYIWVAHLSLSRRQLSAAPSVLVLQKIQSVRTCTFSRYLILSFRQMWITLSYFDHIILPLTTPTFSLSCFSVVRLASPHLLLPLRVLCLISVGSLDIDVPPDMVETFHADSVTSHENYVLKLKADMSSEGPFSPADVPSQGNVSRSASSNSKFELPAAPELLLISGADHYNILDANHESWLRLFEKIKKMIDV